MKTDSCGRPIITLRDITDDDADIITFNIVIWNCDEDGEGEEVIELMDALSESHASLLLKDRIARGIYPKGAWLDYNLDGKKIQLDIHGRIPA